MSAIEKLINHIRLNYAGTAWYGVSDAAQTELAALRQQVETLKAELESRNRETINLNKDRDHYREVVEAAVPLLKSAQRAYRGRNASTTDELATLPTPFDALLARCEGEK